MYFSLYFKSIFKNEKPLNLVPGVLGFYYSIELWPPFNSMNELSCLSVYPEIRNLN